MNLKKRVIGVINVQWDTEDREDIEKADQVKSELIAKGWAITSSSPLGKCVLSKEVEIRG